MRFIDEVTDGSVQLGPGTLYRTIARLVADGLVEEVAGGDSGEPHDARRRYYRLTKLGRAAASRETALLARLVDVAAEAGLLADRGADRREPAGPTRSPRTCSSRDVTAAISFYRKAFGAVELFRNVLPDGTVLFIELAVGGARLLVSEEVARLNALAPPSVGGSPVLLLLEVDDVDDLARRAVFAGAEVEMPVQRDVLRRAVRHRRRPVRPPLGAVHPPRAADPRRHHPAHPTGRLTLDSSGLQCKPMCIATSLGVTCRTTMRSLLDRPALRCATAARARPARLRVPAVPVRRPDPAGAAGLRPGTRGPDARGDRSTSTHGPFPQFVPLFGTGHVSRPGRLVLGARDRRRAWRHRLVVPAAGAAARRGDRHPASRSSRPAPRSPVSCCGSRSWTTSPRDVGRGSRCTRRRGSTCRSCSAPPCSPRRRSTGRSVHNGLTGSAWPACSSAVLLASLTFAPRRRLPASRATPALLVIAVALLVLAWWERSVLLAVVGTRVHRRRRSRPTTGLWNWDISDVYPARLGSRLGDAGSTRCRTCCCPGWSCSWAARSPH